MLPPNLTDKIIAGDVLDNLKTLPDNSVRTCITSPPYYGLRDYGTGKWIGGNKDCKHFKTSKNNNPDWKVQSRHKVDGGSGDAVFKNTCPYCGAVRVDKQIGLEKSPQDYIDRMVIIFRQVKRVLTRDGTLWVNIGDSYWGGKGASGGPPPDKQHDRLLNGETITKPFQTIHEKGYTRPTDARHPFIKPKDLIGIPWEVALALRNDGWYLRSDIIWNKTNPMPESVKDRPTKSHEYIFLLSKSDKYYYDHEAIKEDMAEYEMQRRLREKKKGMTGGLKVSSDGKTGLHDQSQNGIKRNREALYNLAEIGKANKKSVWTVATIPFTEAHFATFPEDLIVPCIKAGSAENDVVLDPFMGAGTTALVAKKLNRKFIGIELNPDYIKIAEKRLRDELGMFSPEKIKHLNGVSE